MPTLDVRGVVVNPKLKVNYHSIRVPEDVHLRRLAEALDLGRLMVQTTLQTLRVSNRTADPDPIVRRILESHFHLASITTGHTRTWEPFLDAIIEQFQLIYNGLIGSITISDAISMLFKRNLIPPGYTSAKPEQEAYRGRPMPHLWGSIH